MSNSIKELLSKLSDMHNAEQDKLQKKEKEGENFNVFSALNICSDEMRLHSRLLATLFNPKANHGLENEFLRQFLVTAIKVDDNYITHCNESIAERYVGEVTETTGGRIDIILEDGKHGIIIENKIYACDQPNQLLRYHNYGVKQFGDKLRQEHIIKPLIGIGFKQRQDDNGALWKSLNSKKNHFIVIKTDKAYWKEVWIAVASEDKTIPLQPKLDCFTDEPTSEYPYGWSWISDNEGNNWHDIAQYPAIGKEEVLKWIKNKIREIEDCFKN